MCGRLHERCKAGSVKMHINTCYIHVHTLTQGALKQIKTSTELMSVLCRPLGPYSKQITHSGANQPRDQASGWREGKLFTCVGMLHLSSSGEERL